MPKELKELYVSDQYFVDGSVAEKTDALKKAALFPKGGPSHKDIIQSNDLCCFLLAPMGSIADLDPDYIKNMIHDNDDGTVTVHFYAYDQNEASGSAKKPYDVRVDKTPMKGIDSDSALWVQMLEKAFAASGLNQGNKMYERNPGQSVTEIELESKQLQGNKIDPQKELLGGDPTAAASAMTAEVVDKDVAEKQKEIVKSANEKDGYEAFKLALLNAMKNKQPIVLNTDMHAVMVTDVVQGSGSKNAEVQFYDQYNSKEDPKKQKIDLEELFKGTAEINGRKVQSVQYYALDKATHQLKGQQSIYVSNGNLTQQIKKNSAQKQNGAQNAPKDPPRQYSEAEIKGEDKATQDLLKKYAAEDKRAWEQFAKKNTTQNQPNRKSAAGAQGQAGTGQSAADKSLSEKKFANKENLKFIMGEVFRLGERIARNSSMGILTDTLCNRINTLKKEYQANPKLFEEMPVEKLNAKFAHLMWPAKRYISYRKGKNSFSSTQLERLKCINQLMSLNDSLLYCADSKDYCFGYGETDGKNYLGTPDSYGYTALAEKLVLNKLIQDKDGATLCDRDKIVDMVRNVLEGPSSLKEYVRKTKSDIEKAAGKTFPEDKVKKRMLMTNGQKLLKGYQTFVKNLANAATKKAEAEKVEAQKAAEKAEAQKVAAPKVKTHAK